MSGTNLDYLSQRLLSLGDLLQMNAWSYSGQLLDALRKLYPNIRICDLDVTNPCDDIIWNNEQFLDMFHTGNKALGVVVNAKGQVLPASTFGKVASGGTKDILLSFIEDAYYLKTEDDMEWAETYDTLKGLLHRLSVRNYKKVLWEADSVPPIELHKILSSYKITGDDVDDPELLLENAEDYSESIIKQSDFV